MRIHKVLINSFYGWGSINDQCFFTISKASGFFKGACKNGAVDVTSYFPMAPTLFTSARWSTKHNISRPIFKFLHFK